MRLVMSAALLASACASLDQFDVPLTAEGTIPGSLSAAAPAIADVPAGADVAKKIDNVGVAAGDITSARLTKGSITVTAPATGHLMTVQSLELWARAPGLPDVRIAHQDAAFANKQTTYDLVLDAVELRPYVVAPSMTLAPKLVPKSRPAQDVAVRLDLNLFVDLSVID
jgi:hypothetical protein